MVGDGSSSGVSALGAHSVPAGSRFALRAERRFLGRDRGGLGLGRWLRDRLGSGGRFQADASAPITQEPAVSAALTRENRCGATCAPAVIYLGHFSAQTPLRQPVQPPTRMQASPEPQSRFSRHLSRLVGHLEVASCFTHSGPSCVPRDHDTEVVQRETFIERETLPEYQVLVNALMLLGWYRTGEGPPDSFGHTL